MANRDVPVEPGKARCEGRRRVAMYEDQVGSERIEDIVKPLKHSAGYAAEALPRAHQVEIKVGNDVEQLEHLIEHLPVLCAHTHAWLVTRVHL